MREFFLPEDVDEQERRDGRVTPRETGSRPEQDRLPRAWGQAVRAGASPAIGAPRAASTWTPTTSGGRTSSPGNRHLLFQPPAPHSGTLLWVKMALSTLASPQL